MSQRDFYCYNCKSEFGCPDHRPLGVKPCVHYNEKCPVCQNEID